MNSIPLHLEMGSHLHVLLPCLLRTRGAVLELGCGCYSTAILSLYSQSRYCRTVETNSFWLQKVKNFFPNWCAVTEWQGHDFRLVECYRTAMLEDRFWDVVFIDQKADERAESAYRLRTRSRFTIIHDTERDYLDEILNGYRYRYDFREIHPHTSVGSDTDDLVWLAEHIQCMFPPHGAVQ